jgi:hypothetical protein
MGKAPRSPAQAPGTAIVPAERIDRAIHVVRGQKVMLDSDLAALYVVPVGRLNEAVKRNRERFPADFTFQLTPAEHKSLLSQSAIPKPAGRGGRRTPPFAFTEQGVAMLSSVLRSDRAVAVNVEIMRAFVRLRQIIASHDDLRRKLARLERKYDKQFAVVFDAIRQLMEDGDDDASARPRIGYETEAGG